MARTFVAASSQALEVSVAVLTAMPITMVCWAKPTTLVGSILVSLTDSTNANRRYNLQMSATGASVANQHDGTTNASAATTATIGAGALAHFAGKFTSTASRTAYLNGTGKTTNATAVALTMAACNNTVIGARHSSGGVTTFFNGVIAEVGIWSADLDDDEIAALAKGVSPLLVRPSSLECYVPIGGNVSPELDRVGGLSFVLSGAPAKADHPRIYYPASVRLPVPVLVGAPQAVSGDTVGTPALQTNPPTVVPGSVAVSAVTRATTIQISLPTVTVGPVTIFAPTRASFETLYVPTVVRAQLIAGPTRGSAVQMNAPGVVGLLPTVSRVQATTPTVSTAFTQAVTFTTTPLVGNGVVVAAVTFANTGLSTVTDNAGNLYTICGSLNQPGVPSTIELWVCHGLTATATPLIVTVTGANAARMVVALEVSYVGGGLVVDQLGGTTGSGTTASTGGIAALTVADVFAVAVVGSSSDTYTVQTVTPPWQQEAEGVSSVRGEIDSRVLTGVLGTNQSASWTLNGANYWVAAVVALKATALTTTIAGVTCGPQTTVYVPTVHLGVRPPVDQYRNLAYGVIEVTPTPPDSGTTMRVRFAYPATFPPPPFNATVWPVQTMPTELNAEIVRVTDITGAVFTITRAQEGTQPMAFTVGDQVAAAITKKLLDDVRAASAGGAHGASHETGGADALQVLDATILTSGTLPDARLSANVQMKPLALTDLPVHAARHQAIGLDPVNVTALAGYPGGTTSYLRADGTFATPATGVPGAHHLTHEPGGGDELLKLDAAHLTIGSGPVSLLAKGTLELGADASAPVGRWTIPITGHLFAKTDNLYDIGASGVNRPRDVFIARNLTVTGAVTGATLQVAHHATHEVGGSDVIANVAWTNVANTFTQNQVLAGTVTTGRMVSVVGANPFVGLTDTNQAVDARAFIIANSSGTLKVQSYNDAFGVLQATALSISRAGVVTVPWLVATGSYPQIRLESNVALISFKDTTAAVDAKIWRVYSTGGLFVIDPLNDAESALAGPQLIMNRAGKVTFGGQVQLPATNPVLLFGGATNAFPALRCPPGGGAVLEVVSADGPPASVFAPLRAHHFLATASGNNLFDLTCGATNFQAGVTVTAGGANITGDVTANNRLMVFGGSGTSYATAPIEVRMAASPRIAFHWPGVVASQLGMDSAGTITAWDNPGSNYGNFRALGIYAVGGFYGPKPPRIGAYGSGGAAYPDCNAHDLITADQTNGITFVNPINVYDGFNLVIRFRDNGASAPIYWQSAYRTGCPQPLPSATVPSKATWCAFRYHSLYGLWFMLSTVTEP